MNPRAPGVPTQRVNVVELSPGEKDERELIASVLRKDRKAAARLVAAHIDAVYSYVRHRLATHADLVDDVVQDVFLAALKGLAAFEGQSSLRTWLVAIARHKIEDIYRQRLRTSVGSGSPAWITRTALVAKSSALTRFSPPMLPGTPGVGTSVKYSVSPLWSSAMPTRAVQALQQHGGLAVHALQNHACALARPIQSTVA